MKLYLISQTANRGYDTYDSAVVCAPDEETARHMDPGGEGLAMVNLEDNYCWANDLANVTVEFLGEAKPGMLQGVVCASFNAG